MKYMLQICCKNNNIYKEVPIGSSLLEIYREFDLNLPYQVVSAKVNNRSEGLNFRVYNNKDIEFLDVRDPSGMRTYVRSLCFVLYKAVNELFPQGKLYVEHPVSKGYFCNLRLGRPIGTNAAYQYFSAGIWVNDSYNVVFQNNEAAYTFLRNGAGDGEGFDIDISCRNIYFQNNYAHHNEGGGLLLCNNSASLYRYDAEGNIISPQGQMETLTGDWGDNYVRNNVFAYNGTTADSSRSAFLTICRQVDDLYCYNNTVILGSIENQAIINIEDTRASKGHYYANNIFYSEQPTVARMNIALLNEPVFKNNLYFNLTGAYENTGEVENGTAILDVDPQIELPSDYDGINKMTYFAGNNPLLYTLGILIDGSLEFDPCGASAKGVAYIGAFAQKGRENEIL